MIYNSAGIGVTTNIHNVLTYGAVGNGITDDTQAINKVTTEIAANGGIIYFPLGTYLVSSSILFKSNQVLLFENGATLLSDGTYNNIMMNYSTATTGGYDATNNVDIIGATFDGGNGTVNNTLFGCCHSQNIRIKNCVFKNAYGSWHNIEINSSKNVLIENCDFEGHRKTSQNGCMIQLDAFNNTATWPWGNGLVDNTISKYVEIRGCYFHNNTVSPAIGNHSALADDFVKIHDNVFDTLTGSRGAINFQNYTNVDVYNNTFNGCTTGVTVGTNDGTNTVHDNEFIGVTTVSSGCVEYSNFIDGVLQGDLTDYVKNTDYATSSKGGVIKSGQNAFQITEGGTPWLESKTYSQYTGWGNPLFISKGTLEAVLNNDPRIKEPQYVLLAEKTYSEASTTGTIWEDANNGVDDVMIMADGITGTNGSNYVVAIKSAGTQYLSWNSAISDTTARNIYQIFERKKDDIYTYERGGYQSGTSIVRMTGSPTDSDKITRVAITLGGNSFTAGTIKIYGRKRF